MSCKPNPTKTRGLNQVLWKGWQFLIYENSLRIYLQFHRTRLYMEYISLLIRYSRACDSYRDSLDRELLLNQGFLVVEMKLSLRRFSDRYHDSVYSYGIFVSKWPRICSVFRYHYRVLSSSMTYQWVYNKRNSTNDSSGARTVILPEHLSSSPFLFWWS